MKKRAPAPERDGTAGVVADAAGRLLIVQRPSEGLLGSLWKLPGGFSRSGEPPEATLERTVREELGIRIRVGEKIGAVKHVYTHFRLTLHVFAGRTGRGRPRALGCRDWVWVPLDRLAERPFSEVDRKAIAVLAAQR